MEEEVEKYRAASLNLCNKILYALEGNREDADAFFGGELHKSYISATDIATNKVKKIAQKIRNL